MRLLAFYLPQFHRIPENDAWWGEGFTEWVNVSRARPLFQGHDHPRVPGDLGQYDLTQPEARRAQSGLARQFGVDAFCIYFYWFDGARLLEQPLDAWRDDAELLPYCISWANEAWTRRWDGRNKNVLMPQSYPTGYTDRLFGDMLSHFQAPHYVREEGKPVLLVHRPDLIPNPIQFSTRLRELAVASGIPGLYIVATETLADIDPRKLGFDAVAEFPPVGVNRFRNAHRTPLAQLDRRFRGRLLSYNRVAHHFLNRARPQFTRHRGVMPGWDNTARRGPKATIYIGHSPERYKKWLRGALDAETKDRGDHGLVFINAWNEWAEGAYLEPDRTHGFAYLKATRAARLNHDQEASSKDGECATGLFWRWGQVRSLLRLGAGSAVIRLRGLRNRRPQRR